MTEKGSDLAEMIGTVKERGGGKWIEDQMESDPLISVGCWGIIFSRWEASIYNRWGYPVERRLCGGWSGMRDWRLGTR